MAKRAPSAYFVYSESVRAEVKEQLKAATEDGKVSVADVAKEIGRLWKELPDEVKQQYKDQAAEAHKAAVAAAAEAAAGGADDQQPAAEAAAAKKPAALPLGTVKKLVMCDKDVKRISADALWMVARATECFLEMLSDKCLAAAKGAKRRTIKMDDFEHAVRRDKRLVEVGLKQLLPAAAAGAQAGGIEKENWAPVDEGAQEAKRQKREGAASGKPGKKAAAQVDAKVPKITSFFSKVAPAAKPVVPAATAAS